MLAQCMPMFTVDSPFGSTALAPSGPEGFSRPAGFWSCETYVTPKLSVTHELHADQACLCIQGLHAIRHIPCIAVQGRLDFVCPIKTAFDLHQAWPEMELRVVPGAGHSMYDPAIAHELLEATDRMRQLPLPPPPPSAQSPQGSKAIARGQQLQPV